MTHDIGNMVGFAFAAQYPERVTRFVLIDAPLPGRRPWEEILEESAALALPLRRAGHGAARRRRERIYLDRFWNEFSADSEPFSEAAREHYAKLYALPGAMRSGFAQFAAFDQDAIDNQAFLAQRASSRCRSSRSAARNPSARPWRSSCALPPATSREGIVPDSGHWIMEEKPKATIAMVVTAID